MCDLSRISQRGMGDGRFVNQPELPYLTLCCLLKGEAEGGFGGK